MAMELEVKYRLTPGQKKALEARYPGPYQLIQMETRYYDTPSGELSRRKWTLRCRRENDRAVCTLKTPTAGLARGEWEVESRDICQALPSLAAASGHPELLDLAREGLRDVCGARFTRKARILEGEACTLELALDEGVVCNGSREQCFSEVELEQKRGTPEALMAFAKTFAAEFSLQTEPLSKFARARALGKEMG